MEYYYDIYLNFYDYPINYYEWDKDDNIERILKIPVIKIDDIKVIIANKVKINLDLDRVILTDGINCIAVELIDSKVAYLSYLPYDDEASVCEMAHTMDDTLLDIEIIDKAIIPTELRTNEKIKNILLKKIEEASNDLLKYIYYDITLKVSNNIDKIKNFLKNDIKNNFNEKYINIFERIYK